MAYCLRIDESVQDGIRRVISEQIDRSLRELADPDLDRADTIHQVRKRCKKIRATLRLVQGALGNAYSDENACYHDAARRISDIRDAEAMIETCDALAERFVDPFAGEVIRPVRKALEARKKALMEDTDWVDRLLRDFESAMTEGHKHASSLVIAGDGWEGVLAGMRKTYTRARAAMKTAYRNSAPETFHEWRKQVKYHWYHMRLLREAWPTVLRARRDEADKLAEALGDHHNLCVLHALLLNDPASFAEEAVIMNFIQYLEKGAMQIERETKSLGGRLFAEKPKHLARRFAIYLNIKSDEN